MLQEATPKQTLGFPPVGDPASILPMHLSCAKCSRPLTVECHLGSSEDYARDPGIRQPTVPQGIIVVVPFESGEEAVVSNPLDIHPGALASVGVDSGCCGSDGMDGLNRACVCGAVLGTEWSDCWTPAEIRFDPDAIIMT